jgi:hypothetical protein
MLGLRGIRITCRVDVRNDLVRLDVSFLELASPNMRKERTVLAIEIPICTSTRAQELYLLYLLGVLSMVILRAGLVPQRQVEQDLFRFCGSY